MQISVYDSVLEKQQGVCQVVCFATKYGEEVGEKLARCAFGTKQVESSEGSTEGRLPDLPVLLQSGGATT